MSRVFRIHSGAANTIQHWDNSAVINKSDIATMSDANIEDITKEITSLPTPFARINLVKQAFKFVLDTELDGNTQYHKIVSDTLDLAQIVFNINKFRDIIEIIEWHRDNSISKLKQSTFPEQNRLGRTLDLYLKQDGDNFSGLQSIFIFNYIGTNAPKPMNIIGATSPLTLFCSSPNKMDYIAEKISFGTDKPFDIIFTPLYKRDIAFVKYLWAMMMSNNQFSLLFPEIFLYLQTTYAQLNDEQKVILNSVNPGTYGQDYNPIPTNNPQISLSSNGILLMASRPNFSAIRNSGFTMVTSKAQQIGNIPLVLPVSPYQKPTNYVNAVWDRSTKVPYYDPLPINDRTLPSDGTKYPYITIGDFLTDTIIKAPYRINSDCFFDGNLSWSSQKDNNGESYILPLSKTFFDYFSAKDLTTDNKDKKIIELDVLPGGSVNVTLRIPINEGYIQYDRLYLNGGTINRDANKGVIVDKDFTIGTFPPLKYPEKVQPYYRIALLDRDTVSRDNTSLFLNFYDAKSQKKITSDIVYRNRNNDSTRQDKLSIDEIVYAFKDNFDYMVIGDSSNNRELGIIVPLFVDNHGTDEYRFAVDFGTTNTHIEYSVDDTTIIKPFDIKEYDNQLVKLFITDDAEIRKTFFSDFLPERIGNQQAYSFPMRTALSESRMVDWDCPVYPMAHTNIAFSYEKRITLSYNRIKHDLKWSTNTMDQKRASNYIECLLFMLRNKVLLNGGDISKTKIVWFYPVSMSFARFNTFKQEWTQKYVQLFGPNVNNIYAISESIAPYHYFKKNNGTTSTVVSIDIGGGTTDVLIADNGKPIYFTSFRFAANSIFGDGYSHNSNTNGIVQRFEPMIGEMLIKNNQNVLREVLTERVNSKESIDIIAFFFSLASNKELKDSNISIDFSKMFSNDDDGKRGKYIIVLFYTAIIYHIATIMKSKNISMPRHITFSGNGSKVINMLTTNITTVEKFTKLIFETIYENKYNNNGLEIVLPRESKEYTCKGGLEQDVVAQDYSDIRDMKKVLIGIDDSSFADSNFTYQSINEEVKENVISQVKRLIDFMFSLDCQQFSFYEYFEIDRTIKDSIKELCLKDIDIFLNEGLSKKAVMLREEGAGEDSVLEESLFFYPIVGILNSLSRNIYKLKK